MASAGRLAAIIGRRSTRIRPTSIPKTFTSNHKSVPAFTSPTGQFADAASRFAPVLRSLGTMLPLHSTIAAARLKSNIAIDTSCWSWLSQDFAIPRRAVIQTTWHLPVSASWGLLIHLKLLIL